MTATAQDGPAAGDVRARARAFVTEDLWPLEHKVLRRELSSREEPFVPQRGIRYRCDPLGVISPREYDQLLAAAAARGLAGLEVSRDLGGQALPVADKLAVVEEMGKTMGGAFVPLQNRLSLRRLEMMISRARERYTFGAALADRQIIQEWIADAAMRLHATRLVCTDAAGRVAAGDRDVRMPAATAKLMATELLNDVADRCLQVHGALGASKDLPIEHYYRLVRVFRIAEGPSEIQKTFIAREVMRHGSSW